jgi:hypothetical protein
VQLTQLAAMKCLACDACAATDADGMLNYRFTGLQACSDCESMAEYVKDEGVYQQ